jgi:hypothetical protein
VEKRIRATSQRETDFDDVQVEAGGAWKADSLCTILKNNNFTIDFVDRDRLNELAISIEPCMIIISKGVHHTAIRRFERHGPLILFSSKLREPVHVPQSFFKNLKRKIDLKNSQQELIVIEVSGSLLVEHTGEPIVAARLPYCNEEFISLTTSIRETYFHQMAVNYDVNLISNLLFNL